MFSDWLRQVFWVTMMTTILFLSYCMIGLWIAVNKLLKRILH